MQKRALLALLLVICLVLSSCSLIKKDMAVDAATEIIKVAGQVFTKGDVQAQVQSYLQQEQLYYSQYYGYAIDITNSEIVKEAQDAVIEGLIENAVLESKTKELGFDTLTDEETADVDETWQSYYDLVKNYVYSDSELEGDELDAAIVDYVTNSFGVTRDMLVEEKVQDKLRDKVVEGVTVSDEELQAEFDSRVESAKASYESNLSSFGTSYNQGSTIYYRPAGYRLVKQILRQFTEEDQDLLDGLDDEVSSLNSTVSSLKNSLTEMGVEDVDALLDQVTVVLSEVEAAADAEESEEDASPVPALESAITETLSEDVAADVKDIVLRLKEAQEKLAYYQNMRDRAQAEAYVHLDAETDDILKQIADGADWDELMAEKTEDPGMQSGTTSETGYAVCENMSGFDSAFVNAAMALENVGDVSDKIASDLYGYYIIKYVGDVEEGPVALADVEETIRSSLQSTKESEVYEAQVAAWVEEAGAVVDTKALND